MRLPSSLRLAGLLLAGGTALSGAERSTGPDFPSASLLQPAIAGYAQARGVPTSGIDGLAANMTENAGDTQTFLVTLRKGAQSKQWLVQLRVSASTPAELKAVQHGRVLWMRTDDGHRFEFNADATTALDVWTAGPFAPERKLPPEERKARAMVSPDMLKLGLDQSCAAMLRLEATKSPRQAVPGRASASPPSEEAVRSFVGLFPALIAFEQGIEATPGLDGILWSIMDKPSAWSVVRHVGKVDIGLDIKDPSAVDARSWGTPDPPAYRLPLTLSVYKQPALRCILFVTAPRPPLVASAGIVGIVAVPPSRPADRLDIRLIAAHTGGKAL